MQPFLANDRWIRYPPSEMDAGGGIRTHTLGRSHGFLDRHVYQFHHSGIGERETGIEPATWNRKSPFCHLNYSRSLNS